MTDISQFAPTSEFDVSNIDGNLQAISAVERTWRSPKLPEEVKLDLAALPGVTSGTIVPFLQAVDSERNGDSTDDRAQEEPADEPGPIRFQQNDPNFERSGYDQLRVIAAGVAGQPDPTDPTVDAVKRFKERAIERGLMDRPENGIVDSRWTPELNSVRYEMAFEDWNDNMSGDRYGAAPVSTVMAQLEKWTSPTGLLAAATELDLFWDFGAVSNEFSSWGDKWRKLHESNNPFEFGKNLIDAVTGPIDDVVMPIVNWALIGSGVGGLTLSAAKGGMLATRYARGAKLVENVFGSFSAANLKALAAPSWTAQKLAGSSRAGLSLAGEGLKLWRANKAVVAGKAVAQTGMRLGFTSQAQDLLPGYQGGVSLAGRRDDPNAIGEVAGRFRELGRNPAFMPVELMIAPYNIFTPGTFFRQAGEGAGLVSRTASGLWKVSGTYGGRAVIGGVVGAGVGTGFGEGAGDTVQGAAFGALAAAGIPHMGRLARTKKKLPYVGGVFDTIANVAAHTDFKPLANNQLIVSKFDGALRRVLSGDDLDQYKRLVETSGSVRAGMKHFLRTEDDQVLDSFMAFAVVSASIDTAAKAMANGAGDLGRYHRFRNKLIGQLRSFDFDMGDGSVNIYDVAASVAMRESMSPQKFKKAYEKAVSDLRRNPALAAELANQQNRIAAETTRQLLSDGGPLEEFDDAVGFMRPAAMGGEEGASALEAYLVQMLPTMGRWQEFQARSDEIFNLQALGALDGVTLKNAINPRTGREMLGQDRGPIVFSRDPFADVDDALVDSVIRNPAGDEGTLKVLKSKGTSIAAQTSPGGRLTPALKTTKMKHDFTEEMERIKWFEDVRDKIRTIDRHKVDLSGVSFRDGVEAIDPIKKQQLAEIVKGNSSLKKAVDSVIGFARANQMDAADVLRALDDEAAKLANDVDRWSAFGLGKVELPDGVDPSDVWANLKARRKQLSKQRHYTASEVEVDKLVENLRQAGRTAEADELATMAAGLDADGYKLAYGVEFLTPHDVSKIGPFADMSAKNVHAMTIGNAFKGRLPIEARALQVRRERLALIDKLSEHAGMDLEYDNPMIDDLLHDLRTLLDQGHANANALVDQIHNQSIFHKVSTALATSATPLRLEDMTKNKGQVIEWLLSNGYDRSVAEAAWLALPKFRNTDFKDLGFYSFEAKLRSNNQAVSALKFAGGRGGLGTSAAVGGYVGYTAAGPGDSDEDFGERILGGVIGMAAGAAAGALGGAGARKLIPRAELSKYGYIADQLVRVRDTMRFTLSPFFDISRYTEGQMLGQTAAPLRYTDDVLDDAGRVLHRAGDRVILDLDASPTGVRRRLRKELQGKHSKPDAERLARQRFDQYRDEFRAAARGDFDPEVLDSTGKWFSQVGIMGFNPTDWMAGSFAELRRRGFSSEEAYQHARNMYTYGTRGRSAAELSVNFILFPFSFQKKALGHIGKWMNTDLGRSIIIHDAYKLYQTLDEEHNLDELWRDHIPAMRYLNRLNMFNYGLSFGRLGGINAPFVEPGVKAALSVFQPAGLNIRAQAEAAEIQDTFRQLLPVYNDINRLADTIPEQANVVMPGGSGMTRRAEVRKGYEEWNEYRRQVSQQLERQGLKWSDLMNKPYLASQKLQYESFRSQLATKYPGWAESRTRSVQNNVALSMEKDDRLARAAAGNPIAGDQILFQIESFLEAEKQNLAFQGVEVGGADGWEYAPVETFERVQRLAQDLYARNPLDFPGIWDKFYIKQFGPLEAVI